MDKNYMMQTGTMMQSFCFHHRDVDVTFHIIVDGSVDEKHKERLKQGLDKYTYKRIAFYKIDDNAFSSYPQIGIYSSHVSKASYYRLMISALLPVKISKVLYLDGDIIINRPLLDLWDTDLSQIPIAAIPDMDEREPERYKRLCYSPELGYFNAGVLLINMEYWRNLNITHQFMDFIANHADRIMFHDQDVLNYIFRETKLTLPLKYNVQNGFFYRTESIGVDVEKYRGQLEEAISNPVIIHFCCSQKPWIIGCQHPYTQEFEKYRNMTPWRHRCIIDTLRYSGLRHTVGYYARKLGLIPPMEDPYISL